VDTHNQVTVLSTQVGLTVDPLVLLHMKCVLITSDVTNCGAGIRRPALMIWLLVQYIRLDRGSVYCMIFLGWCLYFP